MNDPNDDSYGGNSYGGNSYGGSGYEANGLGAAAANALGAGDTAWQRDLFSDGFKENVYANNFADTPLTETFASPDGGSASTSYNSYSSGDYSDEQLEL